MRSDSRKRNARRTGKSLIAFICILYAAQAPAKLYRYINEDGVTVLNSSIPTRYVRGGYTVLSNDGRVIEIVPRALTFEEKENLKVQVAEDRAREQIERDRELADESLMRIYSAPEDVIKARDSKLSSIAGFIDTSRTNLTRLETQKRKVQSQLADIERAGGTISKERLEQMESIEKRIRQSTEEIESKQREMEQLHSSFADDLKRVTELYASKGTL